MEITISLCLFSFFFLFFLCTRQLKKKTPQKRKHKKNPKQPNKKTFCCVLSNQSARSPSNIFCFLKRENSAVSLATLYHDLNLKNKNKIDPRLYTVCDCAELGVLGWVGGGPGSGPMQKLWPPGQAGGQKRG